MTRHMQVFMLAIAFDFYWTIVVIFRERGVIVWLALALLACLMLKPIQRLYAILLAVAGSSLDTLWSLTGLLRFNGEGILPLWMMALWLMFACVWTQLTTTTALPRWLLVLMATAGGPVAYFLGERLDAITFQAPAFVVLSWMAMGWLVLTLFFHLLVGRQK